MSLYKNDKLIYLKQAVNSILGQSYSNFDFYIQCDGEISKDCDDFLNNINDTRVFVRKRAHNMGLAFSLNEMLKIILKKEYKYIARMDADDICVTNRFQKQIEFMQNNSNVDILGGYIEEINEINEKIQSIKYPLDHNTMKNFFGKRNPLAHMTVFFRSTYFEKAGLYPENTKLDEDTMFWYNGFYNNCIFANIPDILVRVRVNSDFYARRNGFIKSFNDFKNRFFIIKNLKLSRFNYILALSRFIIMSIPSPVLTKLAYKMLRK